eukprot:jgi/Astpho2/1654/e_gw1.00032.114.1_t
MADDHTVYKGPEGRTTQWEDIQRKMGNLPPKEPPSKPDPWTPDKAVPWCRQQRMQQLKTEKQRPKFGTVTHITSRDFVQQVTNAGDEVWVVVHLYKDGVSECATLQQCFDELAEKYPRTKFLKIYSTDCIPNYPDRNLPTTLIYKDTKCIQHLIGIGAFGGPKVNPERVAFALNHFGPVCRAEGEEDQPLELGDVQVC